MKNIGTTKSDGVLVEMTTEEWVTFTEAYDAAMGRTPKDYSFRGCGGGGGFNADMTQFLKALLAFIQLKYKATEFQELATRLHRLVGVEKPKELN